MRIKDLSAQTIFLVLMVSFLFTGVNPRVVFTTDRPLTVSPSSAPAPVVGYSVKNDVASLPRNPTLLSRAGANVTLRDIPLFPLPSRTKLGPRGPTIEVDTALQSRVGTTSTPSPIQNFAGISNGDNGAVLGLSVVPPDTDGAVGPNHYVQIVNLLFAVYSKTGTRLYGPAAINSIWNGFGGDCETHNDGDPIALYDHFADRWMISQPAWNQWTGPYYQCIAISTTGDPTGSWYRYAFLISNTKMNDYPKFGVWPDGYYMSINQFTGPSPGTWAGAGAVVFERSAMLSGLSARRVYFDLYSVDPNLGGMLPSDSDGPAPPVGSPNYFVQFDDNAWGYPQDQLEIWQFHVDWTNPASSTFTGPSLLATASFDSNVASIPQPGTSQTLDTLSDRLMYRLQYRNFGSYETLVVCHTVNVSGHAGMRWYELRRSSGSWSIYQQGTYALDSANRWMGSIAMDSAGNLALGYSVSSSSVYPSVRYTGRMAGDPLGTMGSEIELVAGAGSQTGTNRWGDYSQMSIDPADGATFWYTQEYYDSSSARGWKTRIGSFKFPGTTVLVTIASNPTGSGFVVVDYGSPATPPQVFSWILGSTHAISAREANNAPFAGWSCSGSLSCSGLSPATIVTVTGIGTVTANFGNSISFDFRLSNSGGSSNMGGVPVARGSSGSISVTVVLVNGPAQTVTLSCSQASGSPLPSGVSCSPASGTPPFTTTLTITVSSSTAPGYYTIKIIGTAGSLTRSTWFTLNVT